MALTRIGNQAITLDAAEIPNLDASKITTGTLADARISSSSVVQHSPETDLQPIKSDISALALREATNESSAAFNLPNQFIDTFTDDTNLGTQTTVDRTNGYIASTVAASSITMTPNSAPNVTRDSSIKKFGTHSADFADNSSNNNYYLYSPNFNTFSTNRVRTGNFTIDYWFKYSSRTGTDRHFGFGNINDTTEPTLSFAYNASTGTSTFYPNSADISTTYPAQDTDWHHHAFQRDGSTCYMYLDGIYKNSFTFTADLMADDHFFKIGARTNNSTETFEGYIDDFRISNIKRYTNSTNFTPPTSAHTVDGNTSILLSFDNDFADIGSASNTTATGTLIQSANVVGSAKTKVGGTMLYKDNAGTATLGTDLKIYFTCDGGSNWTEASSYSAITPVYSTGIKQVRLGETTCTSGTEVRYKAVWANQGSGSKETQLHGIGVNY